MLKNIAIFGTAGYASDVADICSAIGYKNIVLLARPDEPIETDAHLRIASETEVTEMQKANWDFAIGVAEPATREAIAIRYANFHFPNLIHPNANFGIKQREEVINRKGTIVAPGCVFARNISIGNFCIFNPNVTIGHDCEIGDYVSVMPAVNISGNVSIESYAYLGVSSTILQGTPDKKLVIGEHALVGAGSVVTKPVAKKAVVTGIPATTVKTNTQ